MTNSNFGADSRLASQRPVAILRGSAPVCYRHPNSDPLANSPAASPAAQGSVFTCRRQAWWAAIGSLQQLSRDARTDADTAMRCERLRCYVLCQRSLKSRPPSHDRMGDHVQDWAQAGISMAASSSQRVPSLPGSGYRGIRRLGR
jgi:hypothetical protein